MELGSPGGYVIIISITGPFYDKVVDGYRTECRKLTV